MDTQLTPPTDNELRMARAVLEPLTDTQLLAVTAVVAWEAQQEREGDRERR